MMKTVVETLVQYDTATIDKSSRLRFRLTTTIMFVCPTRTHTQHSTNSTSYKA